MQDSPVERSVCDDMPVLHSLPSASWRIWAVLLMCANFSAPNLAEESVSVRSGVVFTRPSQEDFVEVVRGGELAADVHIKFDGFSVPNDGYLVLKFGGQDTVLCPNAVDSVENCDADGEALPDHQRLTVFNIELGAQELCAEAWRYTGELVSRDCRTLIGSDSTFHPSLLAHFSVYHSSFSVAYISLRR